MINKKLLFGILIVGLGCLGLGVYSYVKPKGVVKQEVTKQEFILTGKDPNGIRLGFLKPGETGIVTYVSGKIISNNKAGFTAPIWGVPPEYSRQDLMPLMPYAKEGMWTNAVYVEMEGKRTPFREGQYELAIKNDSLKDQEVRLNFHEATGWYFDNEGDASFSFSKQ